MFSRSLTGPPRKFQVVSAEASKENNSTGVASQDPHPNRTATVKFTCKVCDHRVVKKVNPAALKNGTVFITCDSCSKIHLLCDNLGLLEKGRRVSLAQMAKMGNTTLSIRGRPRPKAEGFGAAPPKQAAKKPQLPIVAPPGVDPENVEMVSFEMVEPEAEPKAEEST